MGRRTSTKFWLWRSPYLQYALLVLAAALLAMLVYPSGDKGVSRSVIGVVKLSADSTLVVTLTTNKLHGDHHEQISFEATSGPKTRINDLKVCLTAPESRIKIDDGDDGCKPVVVYSKADSAPVPKSYDLTSNSSSGSFKLLVTATWQRFVLLPAPEETKAGKPPAADCDPKLAGCGPFKEKIALSLGPVDAGIDYWARFASRFSRFLKDLTLPIAVILLASWFSWREKEKEEEKQIAHILLPKVMRLSGHYYLPMTSCAGNYADESKSGKGPLNERLFYLLSFFLVARSLKEKEGGVFFKDRAAENIFASANNIVRDLLKSAAGGEKGLNDLLNSLDEWVPSGQRRWPRLGDQPVPTSLAWRSMEWWLRDLAQNQREALVYLFDALRGVIRCESNAPFLDWYSNSGDANPFVIDDKLTPPAVNVFGDDQAERLKTFQELLAVYRKGK